MSTPKSNANEPTFGKALLRAGLATAAFVAVALGACSSMADDEHQSRAAVDPSQVVIPTPTSSSVSITTPAP